MNPSSIQHPASGAAGSVPAKVAIPDHELLRPIGRGGYGEVWLARNVMGSFRAVKIVRRDSFSADRPYEREFSGIQKFEPISRSHPGLMTILHVGRNASAGYFYYVMEVADDVETAQNIAPEAYVSRTLGSEIARRKRLSVDECLRLLVPLCAALSYLHQRGLTHRDIKPSNIIFVGGEPKFADVGLVTELGERTTAIGTIGYIPPEGPGTAAADVYSLGMVLYQISTGKTPTDFPELPTDFRDLLFSNEFMRLNEVTLRACEARQDRRFQTAEQFRLALLDAQRGATARPASIEAPPTSTQTARVVLLSHSPRSADQHLAERLGEALAASGFDLFVDDSPRLSVDWAREIERRIRQADSVIILVSAGACQSECFGYAVETARQSCQRLFALRVDSDPAPRHIELSLSAASKFALPSAEAAGEIIGRMVSDISKLS